MESTLQKPALVAAKTTPKAKTIVYWIVTALFCLEMSFTAYYMLMRLPEGAQAITRLGFPGYFRMDLASALIAHLSMGDGPQALAPSAATSVLWGLSYVFWRRLQATPARA